MDIAKNLNVAIVGGGICWLSLALNLHRRGIAARVYERAPKIKELGVGIILLPHAMREFSIKVEELVGDKPFDNLDDYITQAELRALSENYKRVAGFSLADVAPSRTG
jgi:flavin-dependent dehydrogenase